MKFKERRRDGIPVIELHGRLAGGEDSYRLVEMVTEYGRNGELDLIINMKKVQWIASNGLGILVHARNRYATLGGMLHLCELNERNLDLLTITRVRLLFDICESESAVSAQVPALTPPRRDASRDRARGPRG